MLSQQLLQLLLSDFVVSSVIICVNAYQLALWIKLFISGCDSDSEKRSAGEQ